MHGSVHVNTLNLYCQWRSQNFLDARAWWGHRAETCGGESILPQENFEICGYGDAFWCSNLMAKLYSAEVNLNQRKISIKTRKSRQVQSWWPQLIYTWEKSIINIPYVFIIICKSGVFLRSSWQVHQLKSIIL